jgi:hypothetical protein
MMKKYVVPGWRPVTRVESTVPEIGGVGKFTDGTAVAWFHQPVVSEPTVVVRYRNSYALARPTVPSSPPAIHTRPIEL